MNLSNNLYVELYSEMATAILHDHHSGPLYVPSENGDTHFTDEAQELFEGYVSLVERVLGMVGIHQETDEDPLLKAYQKALSDRDAVYQDAYVAAQQMADADEFQTHLYAAYAAAVTYNAAYDALMKRETS